MSLGSREERLREEVVELREELRRLTLRVDRQADTISQLSALSEVGSLSQSSVHRAEDQSLWSEDSSRLVEAERGAEAARVAEAEREEEARRPQDQEGGGSSLSGYTFVNGAVASTQGEESSNYSWEHREEVARQIGLFLARSLAGQRRGSSGRERLSKLQSKYYIVVRDYSGRVTTQPVRIYENFSAVRGVCGRGSSWGNSIFVGVPSLREGRISVEAAGFDWPPQISQ